MMDRIDNKMSIMPRCDWLYAKRWGLLNMTRIVVTMMGQPGGVDDSAIAGCNSFARLPIGLEGR